MRILIILSFHCVKSGRIKTRKWTPSAGKYWKQNNLTIWLIRGHLSRQLMIWSGGNLWCDFFSREPLPWFFSQEKGLQYFFLISCGYDCYNRPIWISLWHVSIFRVWCLYITGIGYIPCSSLTLSWSRPIFVTKTWHATRMSEKKTHPLWEHPTSLYSWE